MKREKEEKTVIDHLKSFRQAHWQTPLMFCANLAPLVT
jgi:hypothetical protein